MLPQYEHHIIILTPVVEIEDIHKYAKIYCIKHSGWTSLLTSRNNIKDIEKRVAPDIIHSHLFLASFLTRFSLSKKKIFFTIHNLYSQTVFKKPHLKFLEKYIYTPAHSLIGVSKFIIEDYRKIVTKCKKGAVLYNFISDDYFKNVPIKNCSGELNKWIAVGTLKHQKNYEQMIDLFINLKSSQPQLNITLDIYGDGPLMKTLSKKTGGIKYINLMGEEKDILSVIDNYDAYISMSLYEGYGIAPMEALSRGLPLFLSDIAVFKEVYGDHANYVTSTSGKDFLNVIKSYETFPADEKLKIKDNGIAHATSIAGSIQYVVRLLKIYNES